MIFIIDDKKDRQKDFAPFLFDKKYFSQVKLIHTQTEVNESREELNNSAPYICFHDSFYKNPINKLPENAGSPKEQVEKLKANCVDKQIPLLLFSGDFSVRNISTDSFLHSLPVDIFYKNLKHFLDNYIENSLVDSNLLGFGVDHEYEKDCLIREEIFQYLFEIPKNQEVNWQGLKVDLKKKIRELDANFSNNYFEDLLKEKISSKDYFLSEIELKLSKKYE